MRTGICLTIDLKMWSLQRGGLLQKLSCNKVKYALAIFGLITMWSLHRGGL